MSDAPALRILSLGAGVQSTTLALLAAEGRLPRLDAAVFADTGWEPRAVYEHLDRLDRDVLRPAGIDLHRVHNGNLRDDSVAPDEQVREGRARYVALPFHLLAEPFDVAVLESCATCHGETGPDRSRAGETCPECLGSGEVDYGKRRPATRAEREGMGRRQCTAEYKITPIKRAVRDLLGYPHPARIPDDVFVEQWVGISRDESHRAKSSDVRFARNAFPLLHVGMPADVEPLTGADGRAGWTRTDCLRYLRRAGWESTPKSACVGCPFHGNRAWRDLRDNHPEDWADAVAFDADLRRESVLDRLDLRSTPYLHRSRLPLAIAPIDRVTYRENADAQVNIFDAVADAELDREIEEGAEIGCSPWGCRDDGR